MYDPRYPSDGVMPPPSTPHDPIVMVFDGILGKEITLPLVDGNNAVAKFPVRFSYVIPNPYGNDNPLPPTGIPPAGALPIFGPTLIVDQDTNIEQAVQIFPWELTVVFDQVLNINRIMFQIDAIFAVHIYPARFSYVSGATIFPNPQPIIPVGPPTPTDQLIVETVL
jgi:hypothetical protein